MNDEVRAELERLAALAERATPRPWEFDREYSNSQDEACNVILVGPDDKPKRLLDSANSDCACIMSDYGEFGPSYYDEGTRGDFEYIVAACNALPALVRALLAANEAAVLMRRQVYSCEAHQGLRHPLCTYCRIDAAIERYDAALAEIPTPELEAMIAYRAATALILERRRRLSRCPSETTK